MEAYGRSPTLVDQVVDMSRLEFEKGPCRVTLPLEPKRLVAAQVRRELVQRSVQYQDRATGGPMVVKLHPATRRPPDQPRLVLLDAPDHLPAPLVGVA